MILIQPLRQEIPGLPPLLHDWYWQEAHQGIETIPHRWSLGHNSPIQQDLFDTNAEQFEKMKQLDAVIDRINKVNGTETIVFGSQQYTQKDGKGKANVFANAIKHDFKSKIQRLVGVT